MKQSLSISSLLVLMSLSLPSDAAMKWKKIVANSSGGTRGYMEFNKHDTFTVPADVTTVNVLVVGAGGGGSCIKASDNTTVLVSADGGNGGGSNGAYIPATGGKQVTQQLTVTPGGALKVYVGGGGAGTGVGGGSGGANKGGGGGVGYNTSNWTNGANSSSNSGASGGIGQCGGYMGTGVAGIASKVSTCSHLNGTQLNNFSVRLEPGEAGTFSPSTLGGGGYGGGPGQVIIWW